MSCVFEVLLDYSKLALGQIVDDFRCLNRRSRDILVIMEEGGRGGVALLISMVLRSEESLKSEMLSLARTSNT